MLGITVGSVKQHSSRGKEALQRILGGSEYRSPTTTEGADECPRIAPTT